ncbi:MAG: methylmalonyl Co-A mutase-associated GTPase MeaB [bacterium]
MGLADDILNHDPRAVGRLLSLIEDGDPRATAELKKLHAGSGKSYLIGITGPPGSGKSTLVDQIVARYRAKGLRIGVLAIDPSSPFSGGAVLGDRIRMQRHATDNQVFIRSMANRNWPGGLSQATAEAVRVLEAYGCDPVIVETVGVGQSEIEVTRLTHTTMLVCTPATGDKVQALKAGVLEIADIIVMNKADLPGAAHAAKSLEMIISMTPASSWKVPVINTIARDGKGIDDVVVVAEAHRRHMESNSAIERKRIEAAKNQLRGIIHRKLVETALSKLPGDPEMERYAGQIARGAVDPYSIADEIVKQMG